MGMPYLVERRPLLEGFRAGDRAALTEVYRHYAPGVAELLRHGFAFGSAGEMRVFRGYRSSFDLENALQEVFARAFQESALLRYDGLRPYVNYIYAIARNYVIDQLRRRELLVIDAVGEQETPVAAVQEESLEAD